MMTYASVIIPTFNKAPLVCDVVRNLKFQTFKDFEVIVVDDGSTDSTVRDLRQLRRHERHLKIKVLETGMTDEFGMCHAINMGLQYARGTLAFLLNDDIYLHARCIEEHVLTQKRIKLRHAVIGPRFQCPPYKVAQYYGDASTKKYMRRKCVDRRTGSIAGMPVYRQKMMVSSNVSISVDKICKVGGYNEYFKRYSGAIDREFYQRLRRSRTRVLFLFEAQAYSIRYGNVMYRATQWLKDNTWRDGKNVSEWKREQMRYANRQEEKALQQPPKSIERKVR